MQKSLALVLSLISLASLAQEMPHESMDPRTTQIWDLKPRKITAGANAGEAPSDAIVLFDGKNISPWSMLNGDDVKWEVKDGAVTVVKGTGAIKTRNTFGDCQLHIEWRTPVKIEGEGQERGNSGIYIQERYELQVLDSYESITYSNGQAGAIYKQYIPLVNACRKPGEWQTYDVIFTAPHFSDNGRVIIPAAMTVLHNGVLIQNNVQILGPSDDRGLPVYHPHGKASLQLQDHGNPVSYRNIWIREL